MDNRYWSNGCPPLMQDGRFLTNYVRFNVFDQFIRNLNEIGSVHEYRSFLQSNGGDILKLERESLIKNNTCNVNGKCLPLSGEGIKLNGKKTLNVLPCATCYDNKDSDESCPPPKPKLKANANLQEQLR